MNTVTALHSTDAGHVLLDAAILAGLDRLFDDYLHVSERDRLLVIYTRDVRDVAGWVCLEAATRSVPFTTMVMTPLVDEDFAPDLCDAVPHPDQIDGILHLIILESTTMSHNEAIRDLVNGYPAGKVKVCRAINCGYDLFATGLAVGPTDLSAVNATLLKRLLASKTIRVTTAVGTDLQITFDHDRFSWISNRGMPADGKFLVLPCGEVATFPASINGTLVADFAINVNTGFRKDSRLSHRRLNVTVVDGELVEMTGGDDEINSFLERSLRRTNARRVGEVGFGTNFAVQDAFFENSHLNERRPGIHLGFGQHNQTDEATGYFCDIHIDLIARGGWIEFDDGGLPLNLEAINPDGVSHPTRTRSEDVFSPDIIDRSCCDAAKRSAFVRLRRNRRCSAMGDHVNAAPIKHRCD